MPAIADSQPALIDACRRGDRGALEAMLREHAPRLERLIARLVGPGADLEDLLQQSLIAIVQAFPRFRGDASLKTWSSRIAVNIVRQHLRRPQRKRQVAFELVPEETTTDDVAPDGNAVRRRALESLFSHLDAIGEKKRVAFVLHVFEGYSLEAVAGMTGASRSATKSRVFWCRRELLARARKDPALAAYLSAEDTP